MPGQEHAHHARGEMNIPVTAVILTYNEATNIRRCLGCLSWAQDIVIVDSFSEDDTLELAQRARRDCRVFQHEFTGFGDQRNWALDNVEPRFDWVLFLDADEFCTDEVAGEIAEFIAEPGAAVGAYIAGKNYFLGRWLKHSTYYPSYQLRLLRHGEVRFRNEGHGQREVTDGELVYLRSEWRHEPFSKGVEQWIARHNRYSTHEVALIERLRKHPLDLLEGLSADPIIRRRTIKRLAARAPLRPVVRFMYTYFLRFGFLDGYPGLLYCLLRVAHGIHIVAKLAEKRHGRGSE